MQGQPSVHETRWIILGTDGRHVTLGRHSDPTDTELAEAECALRARGSAGWLAVVRGQYYGKGPLSLLLVRPLAEPTQSWDEAVAAFQARRAEALANFP